ncbi:MAG TPA: type II secretion system F family protein [Armatimonadota bacterium]|nr:type II secretion system F family protein [Armatimonadota bacterium]
MSVEFMPCPHCGTENSVKKRICYNCQQEIHASANVAKKQSTVSTRVRKQHTVAQTMGTTRQSKGKRQRSPIISVSLKQRVQMYRQLYSLLNTGIPIGLCFNHLAENSPFHFKPFLRKIAEHIQAGGALSDVMREYHTIFSDWEVSVVLAAEKGGTLPEAARDICESLEIEMDLRTRTRSATFEMKITGIVFLLVLLVVTSVHPGQVSQVMGNIGVAVIKFAALLTGVIIALAGWRMFVLTRVGATFVSIVAPRIPLFGPILRSMARIRFLRVLSTLWHAGVSPYESLEVAAKTTGDRRLMYQISDFSHEFGHGGTLSSIIALTTYLPSETVYMVKTGEESGDVSGSLKKAAEYHTIELEAMVKTLPSKVMVLVTLLMGSAVGWFVISFYAKYFGALLSGG